MDFWVMGDSHFDHKNIAEYCNRPADFEERIIQNLSVVGPNDVLICLGDVAFKRPEYWHRRILQAVKGPCWLILGNHDKQTMTWYLRQGWTFAGEAITLNRNGFRLLFTHEPYDLGDHDFNIHGHLHNTGHRPGNWTDQHILYAPEQFEYRPARVQRLVQERAVHVFDDAKGVPV